MRSSKGFLAAVVFLPAIPAAILCQMIFGVDAELIFHFLGAVGLALLAFAVFDFHNPKWINRIGCAAAGALAFTFLLQGVSQIVQNDSLRYFAFDVLGQTLEGRLVDLVIFWFAALAVFDSRGRTRILGFVAMSIVICVELYSFYLSFLGTSLNAEAAVLKVFFLLPFVWFLFESRKKASLMENNDDNLK
jgi:hypothetical protein